MMIVSKLKKGITTERIIDDIRDFSETTHISRKHLVSRKYITNIHKQYNIEGIRKHPNDLISVSSIIEEMETLDYNPIVLFKQQGEHPSDLCKNLSKEDFVLVIQTEFQRDMLWKYGNDGVCIDATYKINDYDFNLLTLMVLDDYQEGIPIAWALSNREDKTVLVHILQALKEKSGLIKASWFMSDMAQQYYNAWKEVFEGDNTVYLWCAWHVDRAWRDSVKRYFHTKEQQRQVYHQLRALMMETDKANFRNLLTKFLTLSTTQSSAFTKYFNSTYCSHIQQWATCYRVGTPMNTNMFCESFHRVLKIVYLRHQHNRRIDYLIHILLKVARDKTFEQLLKMEKGKHTHRICDINKRHRRAMSFAVIATIDDISDNVYRVGSQSTHGVHYVVKRLKESCTCKLKCQFCSACAQMYSCTCLDACTNTTVCKHMHLVHMQNRPQRVTQRISSNTESLAYYSKVSITSSPVTPPPLSRDLILNRIHKRITDISIRCSDCTDTSILENIYQHLGTALGQFSDTKNDQLSGNRKRKPSHMKSETQPRYFSTRKKRKISEKLLMKPSHDEIQSSQAMLQGTETEICFTEDDKDSTCNYIEWISCSKCSMWVHTTCAESSDDTQEYNCPYCK